MTKEEYYNRIKKWVYGKFDKLEVIQYQNGNNIELQYKNGGYTQIRISKKFGYIYYYYEFSDKICKFIRFDNRDFEILLSRWVEKTFQMKVEGIKIVLYPL